MQKIPICSSCSHTFSVRETNKRQGSRLPLLLICGHTFCETCLFLLAKLNKGFIECQTCSRQTPVTDGVNSLYPNNYLIGLLIQKRKPPLMLSTFSFVQSSVSRQRNEIVKPPTTVKEICSECNLNQATCKCLRCECNMCGICFDKIHSISKTLRKHQAVPLHGDSVPSVSSMCSEHMKPIEYFCEEDEAAICSHCVIMGHHKQHTISSLEDKNKTAITEIEPAMAQANLVYRKLKKSDRVLNDVLPAVKLEVTQRVDEIHSHFQNLHSLLQVREMQLIEQLQERVKTELEPVEKLKADILEQKTKLDSLIRDAQRVMNNNNHVILNAQEVLSKLNVVSEIPCYISRPEQPSGIRCRFEEQDVSSEIADWCKVTTDSLLDIFTLKSLKDLSPEEMEENDHEMDDLLTPSPSSTPDVMLEDDAGSDIFCDIPSSRGTSEAGMSRPSSDASGPTMKHIKRTHVTLVRQEIVYVTHIRNPCDFIIQRCSDTDRLKTLAKTMNKWCNSSVSTKHIPTEVSPDDLVLAKYSLDNNWYRAKVKQVFDLDDTEDGDCADSGNQRVEVYYLDYGNVEGVTLNRLRKMQKKFMKLPELAVQCSLCDIVPASETGEWTAEAIISFAKMTEDKPMSLTLMNKTETVSMVDLSKPGNDDIIDDRPVSVRDCLVFLELACFVSPQSVVKPGGYAPKPQRQFLSPELPSGGEQGEVLISYVHSPDSIYVQMIGEEARYLSEMMVELQRTYSVDDKDLRAVFCPQKHMICVAQYTDQSWYRAQVIELPGRKNVKVHYVDFGNTEMVSYLKLRKILDQFVRLPAQAIECKLADIEPINKDKGWDREAIQWLSENLDFKQFLVKVVDVVDRTIVVQLLDLTEGQHVCINTLMVKRGFAVSTGPGSAPQLYTSPVKISSDNTIYAAADSTTQFEESNHLIVSKSNDSGISVTSQNNIDHTEAQAATSTKTSTKSPSPVQKRSDPAYTHINVSYIKSPAWFYVQLATAGQDGLDELRAALMQKYNESEESHIVWKTDDYCAAQYSVDKKWYRAKVLQTAEEEVQVMMVDYGYEDNLTVHSLRPLLDEFLPQPSFALRCHLVGIQAAGDKTKWSKTACEYLAEQVMAKDCYINIYNMEDGSLPVDLYVEEFIKGDALNADKVEYNDIAAKILDMGLALPIRKKKQRSGSADGQVLPLEGASLISQNGSEPQSTVPPYEKDTSQEIAKPGIAKTVVNHNTEDVTPQVTEEISNSEIIQDGSESCVVPPVHKLDTECVTRSPPDGAGVDDLQPLTFLPPDLPEAEILKVVPTYVDYDGVIYVQEVKEDQSEEGHFGFILKENSLELQLQDRYLFNHQKHRYKISRDGNCLFAVFAKGVYGKEDRHDKVRSGLVRELEESWLQFQNSFGDIDKDKYLDDLAKLGTYGGEPEIQVLCWVYHVHATVYMGGLKYPIQTRHYGNNECPSIELIYVSDGNYDSGHYDLVLDGREAEPNPVYEEWRREHIKELMKAPHEEDATSYDDSLLQQLMDYLQTVYDGSEPEPDNATWRVGQAVVAQFKEDDRWYRGAVKQINEKGIQVLYIDFGNCEYVPPERLRSNPVLTEIPQQSLQCVLQDIVPISTDGAWPIPLLEYLHNTCVGHICSITIKEKPEYGGVLQVNLVLEGGVDLGDWICQTGMAQVKGQEPPASQSDENAKPVPQFDVIQLRSQFESQYDTDHKHQVEDVFPVVVTHIETPDLVYIQHQQMETADGSAGSVRNQQLEELLRISLEISSMDLAVLEDPKPGMACVGRFSRDNCLYRSEILDVVRDADGNVTDACVIYVDYGTPEVISVNELRVLPEEFLRLPVQSLCCQLSALSPPISCTTWTDESMHYMIQALQGRVLLARVVKEGNPLEVELYNEFSQSEAPVLAYQSVIENGHVHLANTVNWGDS